MGGRPIHTPDLGQRFGRWTVTEIGLRLEPNKSQLATRKPGSRTVRVRCDCGAERTVRITVLAMGKSVSCGCYAREVASNTATKKNVTHGLTLNPVTNDLFELWIHVKRRTTNPEAVNYAYYGGRDIRMWRRWRDYPEKFVADILLEIGPRPAGLQLDRIDNEDDYRPGNVRWADRSTQSRNRRPWNQWKKHREGCRCVGCVNRRKGTAAMTAPMRSEVIVAAMRRLTDHEDRLRWLKENAVTEDQVRAAWDSFTQGPPKLTIPAGR